MFFWEKSFQDSLLNEAVAYKTSPWVAINRHQNPLCDNGIGCWYTAFALDIQRIAEASLPKNSKNFADNVNVSEQLGF